MDGIEQPQAQKEYYGKQETFFHNGCECED